MISTRLLINCFVSNTLLLHVDLRRNILLLLANIANSRLLVLLRFFFESLPSLTRVGDVGGLHLLPKLLPHPAELRSHLLVLQSGGGLRHFGSLLLGKQEERSQRPLGSQRVLRSLDFDSFSSIRGIPSYSNLWLRRPHPPHLFLNLAT